MDSNKDMENSNLQMESMKVNLLMIIFMVKDVMFLLMVKHMKVILKMMFFVTFH